MNIDLRHLRCFVAVAEELHFRRAAEILNIAQPALTRTINNLEEEIGMELFERTTRKVKLTPAGCILLEGSRDVQNSLRLAIDRTRQSQTGEIARLVIGYTDFAINDELPNIISSFRSNFPGVTIEPRHGFTINQLIDIEKDILDLGFVTGPVFAPNLDALKINDNSYIAVLPKIHYLAKLETIPISLLAKENFVLGSEEEWKHYHDHLYRLCRSSGFEPHVVQRAFNIEAIFGLVACGMGITVQPMCMENFIRKDLVIRPIIESGHQVPTMAIWNKNALTPAKQNFIDHLKGMYCNNI